MEERVSIGNFHRAIDFDYEALKAVVVQEINNKHKEEMRQQLEKLHEEIKKKDVKMKAATVEYEERLTDAQDKIASLSNQRQQLENQRQNLTIHMHQMMQAHCDEALRLLTATTSPAAKADTKVNKFLFKSSAQEETSKLLGQTPSPPSVFTDSSRHFMPMTHNTQPITSYSSRHNDSKMMQLHAHEGPTGHRVLNHHSISEETQTITNQHHTQHFLHSDPKQYFPSTASVEVPHCHGYQESHPGSVMFSVDSGSEMARSGLDFVPLKAVQDNHDTDSIISGLYESPGSDNGSRTFQDPDYQHKVTSSGDSNGTLLEQDLEDSHLTVPTVSPKILQENRHDISIKLKEQEQCQAELNHYVNLLLKRSPGHPVDEGIDNLPSELMAIPNSVQGVDDLSPFKTSHNPDGYSYTTLPSSIMAGSDSVTKDRDSQPSQNAAPAFTKTTVPVSFSVKQIKSHQHHQIPQYRHAISQPSVHPHTPPRQDRGSIYHDTNKQPPLSPRQMKQLSKLLSLMAEGQPEVQVPSTEQLFGVLKEMQNRSMPSGIQPTVARDTSGDSTSTNTSKQANVSKVKRNLDTSYPSSGKTKMQGMTHSSHASHSNVHTNPPKASEHQRKRLPSMSVEPNPRSGADLSVPRHQAPTKASSRQAVPPKVDKKAAPPIGTKNTKPLNAWR